MSRKPTSLYGTFDCTTPKNTRRVQNGKQATDTNGHHYEVCDERREHALVINETETRGGEEAREQTEAGSSWEGCGCCCCCCSVQHMEKRGKKKINRVIRGKRQNLNKKIYIRERQRVRDKAQETNERGRHTDGRTDRQSELIRERTNKTNANIQKIIQL